MIRLTRQQFVTSFICFLLLRHAREYEDKLNAAWSGVAISDEQGSGSHRHKRKAKAWYASRISDENLSRSIISAFLLFRKWAAVLLKQIEELNERAAVPGDNGDREGSSGGGSGGDGGEGSLTTEELMEFRHGCASSPKLSGVSGTRGWPSTSCRCATRATCLQARNPRGELDQGVRSA